MRAHAGRRRGQTLVIVVLLLIVVTVLALAMLGRSSRESDAMAAKRHHDQAVSCADGAREMLMSQMSIYNGNPTAIVLNNAVDDRIYTTGHYDTFNVTSVQQVSGAQAGLPGVTDIANHTGVSAPGGKVYRMTVVCASSASADGGTNQDEVEFLIRLGL